MLAKHLARLIAVAVLGAAVPAASTPPLPVTVVTSVAYAYAPGDTDEPAVPLRVLEGGSLWFVNLDPLGAHNIVAHDVDAKGRPLFGSPTIGMGEATEVAGVERLRPGTYAFYCEVHNPTMQGVLEVVPE